MIESLHRVTIKVPMKIWLRSDFTIPEDFPAAHCSEPPDGRQVTIAFCCATRPEAQRVETYFTTLIKSLQGDN